MSVAARSIVNISLHYVEVNMLLSQLNVSYRLQLFLWWNGGNMGLTVQCTEEKLSIELSWENRGGGHCCSCHLLAPQEGGGECCRIEADILPLMSHYKTT